MTTSNESKTKKMCGIVMPISEHEDYPTGHWEEVLEIIKEAIALTDFDSKLVSDDVAIGLIHDRIVTNLYDNEVVICDVSSKNPNVMFELGMRLAFDKPTIIIKDDITDYSFDTGVIEHLTYSSSLRFNKIVEFKNKLGEKIKATYNKAQSDPNFSPFLKSFGKTMIPSKIETKEVSESNFILDQLEMLQKEIHLLRNENKNNRFKPISFKSQMNNKKYIGEIIDNSLKEILEMQGKATNEEIISQVHNNMIDRDINISKDEINMIVNNYLNKKFKKE